MNKLLTLTGAAMTVAALTACSPGINEGIGHHVTFDSNGMVVHAVGRPDAHIGKDGSLAIDDHAIAVTPAQRVMLQRYYQQAGAVMSSGKEVGRQGVQIATQSIGAAVRSIFHDGPSSAEKKLDAQSDRIEATADKLCADIKAFDDTQKAIATGIPALAPYATDDKTECTVTHVTTYRVDGAKSSSFTYALREGRDPDTKAASDSTRPTGSATPNASTSSKP
jgi:hypothetical protein